jgi:adenylate cyclase
VPETCRLFDIDQRAGTDTLMISESADFKESVQRKLAAIMSADVVGYSRLMGLDEAKTLKRLSELRRAVDGLIEQRGGRVAGTAGDSVLAEFPSVVEAAACALEVQQASTAMNASYPDGNKMLLRIGLNVGDVIVQDDTIFGDGVNVAARLQGMAQPGGICISQLARDHLLDKATYAFEDLGFLSLKNIIRPVQAFTLRSGSNDRERDEPPQSPRVAEAGPTEIAFWESIQRSTSLAEYEAYLKQYPQGLFSAIARTRLTDLQTATDLFSEEALKVELLFWESVKDSANADLFQAYLERFPEGQFADLAKVAREECLSAQPVPTLDDSRRIAKLVWSLP